MKKYAAVLMKEICGNTGAKWFADGLTEKTAAGFEVESCGVTDPNVAWAILFKPAEPEQPAASDAEAWDWLEQEIQRRAYGSAPLANNVWQAAASLIGEARRRAGR